MKDSGMARPRLTGRLGAWACVCAAALLAQPSVAQQSQPESEPLEIVVTGTRDVDRQLRDFDGALTPARSGEQLARFESAVCPAVVGLGPAQKALVERRLRAVARAAGLDVAPEGCLVNTLLMVADDKKAFIEALQNRHPRYLGNLTVPEIRRLMRAPGSSASWQMTGVVTARGVAVSSDGSAGDLGFQNRTIEPPSRITAAMRPVFEASALLIERRALAGLTTTQLADYAAMRLFARIDPARLEGSRTDHRDRIGCADGQRGSPDADQMGPRIPPGPLRKLEQRPLRRATLRDRPAPGPRDKTVGREAAVIAFRGA